MSDCCCLSCNKWENVGENASKIFSRTYNAAGKHVTCLCFENTTFRANDNVILTSWNEPRHDKTNKMSVRPAKTQISLGILPVWSEYWLCTQWVAKDPSFLHADSEDSGQSGRMPRLILVFAGRTLILLVLSCRGSNYFCCCAYYQWWQ